jgi:HAE1 family hydrophobic/amphiphilic exporter-1
MSFLARLSLANRSVVALATVTLILIGAYVLPTLNQELLPSLILPQITVTTAYPGASPEQVEQDVTNPLEQAFLGLPGITQTTSRSSEGFSVISISYDFGSDLDKAQQKLAEQVNQIQSRLPANVTPHLFPANTDTFPIITLSVSSSQNQQDLAVALNKVVVPDLQSISGVGTVNITGVRQQIVTVTLDLDKLLANGITVDKVQSALQANNMTMPAGEVNSNGQILAVRVGNTFHSIQELKDVVVGFLQPTGPSPSPSLVGHSRPISGGAPSTLQQPVAAPKPITLSDIATVQEDLALSSTLSRVNGKPSLGIALTKTGDGNSVTISQTVRKHLPDLESKLGDNAKITVVSDQAPVIQSAIADLVREGLLGTVFAIVAILVFLFSLRSTLVTSISIPLSVLITLIALWVQHSSLNELTLSGLTVAIGRVVDDAIVILESIYCHLQKGEPKREATLHGVKEVATAVTSSTLTTVAVFLPLSFIGGATGQYTHPLAMTVTIALLASLVVALTIIPVLAYWFLKAPARVQAQLISAEKPSILERGYMPLISGATNYRTTTVILAIVLLIGSFLLFPLLPSNAFGNQGLNSFSFSISLPKNTNLDRTNQAAQKVETVLAGIGNIQTYQTTVGTSSATNMAYFTVNVQGDVDASKVQRIVGDRFKNLSDIGTTSFSSQGTNVVDITVQAPDDQSSREATQQVVNMIKNVPNTADIQSDLSDVVPLVEVQVNPAKAALHGLTAVQVAQYLQLVYSGTTATHVVLDGTNNTQQDVDLKLNTSANTVQAMQDMQLLGPLGPVRLGDVADVSQVNGPTQISHLKSARTTTITFAVTGQNVQGMAKSVLQRITKLHLPTGAKASLGTNSSGSQDTLNQLYLTLLFAIPLVFIVMVATFRSLIQPLILLISIPFAAVGSILLAVVTHTAIGISSLFGALMLIGIVVTNAIVLIDRINHFRVEGLDPRAAVIAGGCQRVRPILMTALATIMALIPMAIGAGGGSNPVISGGLAIVVIGGLTSSTFLTLLLVPTLYVIVEDMRERWQKRWGGTMSSGIIIDPQEDKNNTLYINQDKTDIFVKSTEPLAKSTEPLMKSKNPVQLHEGLEEYGLQYSDRTKGNTVHHIENPFENPAEQGMGTNSNGTSPLRGNNLSDTMRGRYMQEEEEKQEKRKKRHQGNVQADVPDLQRQRQRNGDIPRPRKRVDGDRKKSVESHTQSMRPAEATVQIKIVSGSGRMLKMDLGKGEPKVEGPQETRNGAAGPYIYTYPVKVNHTQRGIEVSSCNNKIDISEELIKIETSEIDSTAYITKQDIRCKIETSHEEIHIFSTNDTRSGNTIENVKIYNMQKDKLHIVFMMFDMKNQNNGSSSYLGEIVIEKGKNIRKKITGTDGIDIEVITYYSENRVQIYRNGKVIIVEDTGNKRLLKVRKKNIIDLEFFIGFDSQMG